MGLSGHIKDLNGGKFGRWTVLEYAGKNKNGKAMWHCICDCGTEKDVASLGLVNGSSKSCGCYMKEKNRGKIIERSKTHGCSNSRLYHIWCSMKRRCHNANEKSYKNYGGRGIKVCDEWEKFEGFYDWAIRSGYEDSLTIERIDVNGNYSPQNCRWATMKEQGNNKRNNKFITIDGETKTIQQWADISGIERSTIKKRINYKWEPRDAVFSPVKSRRKL